METESYIFIIASIGFAFIGAYLAYRINLRRMREKERNTAEKIIEDAKRESERIILEGKLHIKELSLQNKVNLEKDLEQKKTDIFEMERRLRQKEDDFDKKTGLLEKKENEVLKKAQQVENDALRLKEQVNMQENMLSELRHKLENVSGMTADEAKHSLISMVEGEAKLEQAKVLKIKKIIFASSAAVYAESKKLPVDEENIKEPISLYGASKLLSEYLLQNYHKIRGLPYTSLRFANVYGPKQDTSAEGGVVAIFIDKILRNNQVTIFGDGMQTRDFIYVSDIVEACLLSLSNKVTGEFNIGTTQETSILSLYKKLLDLSGAKDNKKFTKRRFLEVARNSLSSEKFKNTTVWKPQVNLTHGLKLTFDYFQKNLNSLAEQRQL